MGTVDRRKEKVLNREGPFTVVLRSSCRLAHKGMRFCCKRGRIGKTRDLFCKAVKLGPSDFAATILSLVLLSLQHRQSIMFSHSQQLSALHTKSNQSCQPLFWQLNLMDLLTIKHCTDPETLTNTFDMCAEACWKFLSILHTLHGEFGMIPNGFLAQ